MTNRKTLTLTQQEHGGRLNQHVRNFLAQHFNFTTWKTLELTADSPYVLVVTGRDDELGAQELTINFYDEVDGPTSSARTVATVCGLFGHNAPRDLRVKILAGYRKFTI